MDDDNKMSNRELSKFDKFSMKIIMYLFLAFMLLVAIVGIKSIIRTVSGLEGTLMDIAWLPLIIIGFVSVKLWDSKNKMVSKYSKIITITSLVLIVIYMVYNSITNPVYTDEICRGPYCF